MGEVRRAPDEVTSVAKQLRCPDSSSARVPVSGEQPTAPRSGFPDDEGTNVEPQTAATKIRSTREPALTSDRESTARSAVRALLAQDGASTSDSPSPALGWLRITALGAAALFALGAGGAGGYMWMRPMAPATAIRGGFSRDLGSDLRKYLATDPGRPAAPRLHLALTVRPNTATSWLDDRPLADSGSVHRVIEVPCPDGGHDLRVEADGHLDVVKRIPCSGAVILDVALVEDPAASKPSGRR